MPRSLRFFFILLFFSSVAQAGLFNCFGLLSQEPKAKSPDVYILERNGEEKRVVFLEYPHRQNYGASSDAWTERADWVVSHLRPTLTKDPKWIYAFDGMMQGPKLRSLWKRSAWGVLGGAALTTAAYVTYLGGVFWLKANPDHAALNAIALNGGVFGTAAVFSGAILKNKAQRMLQEQYLTHQFELIQEKVLGAPGNTVLAYYVPGTARVLLEVLLTEMGFRRLNSPALTL